MAFYIDCLKNTAENMLVDKFDKLEFVVSLRGTLRDECSITQPVITIQYSNIPQFNYVFISNFNRYYYIDNIVALRTDLYELYLRCDLLMSFKNTILNNTECVVVRNENLINNLMKDVNLPISQETKYKRIDIDFSTTVREQLFADRLDMDSYCFILQAYDAHTEEDEENGGV